MGTDKKITWKSLAARKLTANETDHAQIAICLATELVKAAEAKDAELTSKSFKEYLDQCSAVDGNDKKFAGLGLDKINLTSKPPSMPADAKVDLKSVTFSLLTAAECVDILVALDDLMDDDAVKSTPAVVAVGLALSSIFMA